MTASIGNLSLEFSRQRSSQDDEHAAKILAEARQQYPEATDAQLVVRLLLSYYRALTEIERLRTQISNLGWEETRRQQERSGGTM